MERICTKHYIPTPPCSGSWIINPAFRSGETPYCLQEETPNGSRVTYFVDRYGHLRHLWLRKEHWVTVL